MAKKQSATKTKSAAKKPTTGIKHKLGAVWHKHWQLISFSVLILGVLGFIGVQQLLVYNQRQQFKAAEQSLEELSNDIIAATGQPTEVKKDASCGYRSAKWEQGERSCGVFVNLYYPKVTNILTANKTTDELNAYLEKRLKFEDSLYTDEINGDDRIRAVRHFSFSKNNIDCSVEFALDRKAVFVDKEYFRVSVGCYGPAKAEFYPVKN